jgi:hypothetical protein
VLVVGLPTVIRKPYQKPQQTMQSGGTSETHGRESSDVLVFQIVRREVVLSIIDCHSSSGSGREVGIVGDWHTVVGPVGRVLEV